MPPVCSMLGSNLAHSSDWPVCLNICFVIRLLSFFFFFKHTRHFCSSLFFPSKELIYSSSDIKVFYLFFTSILINQLDKNWIPQFTCRASYFISPSLCWIEIHQENLITKTPLQVEQSQMCHLSDSVCPCSFLCPPTWCIHISSYTFLVCVVLQR